MARAGSKKHRIRVMAPRGFATPSLERETQLVEEIWALDHLLGVQNKILQRLGVSQLTDEERAALAGGTA